MSMLAPKEITRLAPGEQGIAQFAYQIMSMLVTDTDHLHRPPQEDVLALMVSGAMTGDPGTLAALTAEFRRLRIPAEAAVDIYIPAAANRIGNAWHDEEIDILEGTIAMARLQQLVHVFSRAWRADNRSGDCDGSILMVVPEGEQHILGAVVATAQMRRLGISVSLQLAPTLEKFEDLISHHRFDALMLSIGHTAGLENAAHLVATVRRISRRPLPVVIGGSASVGQDAARHRLGADFACRDVSVAMDFLGLRRRSHAA